MDIQNLNDQVEALMKTPHYAKLGKEGVFAILVKANALKIDATMALNGGLYYVKGKVEMHAHLMNMLIRQAKHSVSKDPSSDDTKCILHGKRADNGDTWTESFTIAEAKKAGIYGGPWEKYPRDMLFARALSRLARQLFPDIIQGCYVEGEIEISGHTFPDVSTETLQIEQVKPGDLPISEENLQEILILIGNDQELEKSLLTRLRVENLKDIQCKYFKSVLDFLTKSLAEGEQNG